MQDRILLCKPKMCGRELDFIKAALAEDWAVQMGPDVTAFEKELGAIVGVDNVVALESGTSAIHLALIPCGVFEGPNMAAYVNGVSESLFKVGICLPAGPYVTDDDVRYIAADIKAAIVE